jgi:transcriptional regulator with XRE-family HTH domain
MRSKTPPLLRVAALGSRTMSQTFPISALVGVRIRELREGAGLPVEKLAKQAGLSTSALTRIESGGARPSLATLGAIAGGLDSSVSGLIRDVQAADRKADLPARLERIARAIVDLPDAVGDKIDAAELAIVRHAMFVCNGNKSAAARLLGLERKALMRRSDKLR